MKFRLQSVIRQNAVIYAFLAALPLTAAMGLAAHAAGFSLVISPSGSSTPVTESAQPDTLYYDSGGFYYLYGPTDLWGIVRFTAPADFELRCLYLQMSNPNGSAEGVTVYVYDDDGAGNPGEIRSGPYFFNGPLWLGYSWLDVELEAPFPQFSAGDDFFVVFGPAPMGQASEGWFLYTDAYGNTDFRSGYSTSPEGPWSFSLSGDLIVRAGGQVAAYTDLQVTACFNDLQRFFLTPGEVVYYQAEVANVGSLPVTDFLLVWEIEDEGGEVVFSDSLEGGALPAGYSDTFTSPNGWVTGSAGYYAVTASVICAADVNGDNDRAFLEQGVGVTDGGWLYYDDGEPGGNVTAPQGTGWGNRFDPPVYPVKVESLGVGIAAEVPDAEVVLVNINGFSVEELWRYTGPLQEGLNIIPVEEPTIVYSGGIGVGYLYAPGGAIWKDDDPPLAAANPEMPPAGYQITSGSWNPVEAGDWMLRAYTSSVTGVQENGGQGLSGIEVCGIYPNPFNPITAIRFKLPQAAKVTLEVFDVNGRRMRTDARTTTLLQDALYPPGIHEIIFDGGGLSSGIYIYRLTAGEYRMSGKMVLMK